MSITLRGLSWRHRRAMGPLQPLADAFAANHPGITVTWADRSLAGFEHQPIAEAAKTFDLVIFDHPFSGDILDGHIFLPLETALPDLLGPTADALYIGPTLASYRLAGKVFGAPIDAATEHAVYRRDLLAQQGEAVPSTWGEVIALGRRQRARGFFLGAAVVTPHLGLVVAALMANDRTAWQSDPVRPFGLDREGLREALERVRELLSYCPPEAIGWNAIDLHEAMVARDDILYAPCTYGYATYGEADMRHRLGFADFPGAQAPHAAGSVLGGTALGISATSPHPKACLDFLRFALSPTVQSTLIAGHHGQPARIECWRDPTIDAGFNGYYSGITASMEQAWIRPRRKGYITFQHALGLVVERMIAGRVNTAAAVDEIVALAQRVGAP